MGGKGNLYCIRKGYSPIRALLVLVLLPFRLLFVLFQYLNFFTMRYAGKMLVTSGNMRQKHPDMGQAAILMNLLQAHGHADMLFVKGKPVPKSWVLLRMKPGGETDILHTRVLSFDLCDDETLIVTDGKAISVRHPDGRKEELARDEFISQIVAV